NTLKRGLQQRESGSLLIIVLWIAFGLVALTLYFAHSMSMELHASDNRVAAIESNQAIDGAARYLSNILTTVANPGEMPDPSEFPCEAVPVGNAKFWFIGRDTNEWDINVTTPAFGLVDEASKINLNASWLTADMIQYLPGMTLQIATAIMDWRDANSSVSDNGAEDETYSRLTQPYKTKNAPFESVEELRLVAGMTAEIIYGEDANLNGILDPNENDGDDSLPYDNRDGRLDPGLMEYFTVYSREPATGTNVNRQQEVQALLEGAFSQSRATEIMRQLYPSRPPGRGGATAPAIGSILEFYLRSGMTEDEFAQISDYVTATTNSFTEGLVNVNTASQTVLECILGIGTDYASQLISYREANPAKLTSVAWVASAMNSDTNAVLAGPYITTRSYQYTADIAAVGHHNRGYQRVRFVFDTSEDAPRVIRRQDLTHLGWALGKDTRTGLLADAKETR
ncbi:MAG: type II secretion system protein GspK, partial [Verrucomicrobia bacterium]|nr:type II secretion system protein GspK [Verrucomicrobiota bacterium]